MDAAVQTIKIDIPRSIVADIIMERLNLDASPAPARSYALPLIGEAYQGGIFAGVTIHENVPHALVLLPGDADSLNWKDACEWAVKQGGELPSRFDQLVLFKNLKAEFKDAWYWSGEHYAPSTDSAWSQYFTYGYQYYTTKDYYYRARAVRRLVIE